MRKFSITPATSCCSVLALCFVSLCMPQARGGLIVPASASGSLTLTDGAVNQVSPLSFPSSNGFAFTSQGGGTINGTYAFSSGLQDVLMVSVTATSGRAGVATHLVLDFTTAQDALVTLDASFDGTNIYGFTGKLDNLAATAFTDFNQGRVGNIPVLQPLILTALLPAGAHTFSLDYNQGPGPHAPFESFGTGSFQVSLAPIPAVPMPSAFWLGLIASGAVLVKGWHQRVCLKNDEGTR